MKKHFKTNVRYLTKWGDYSDIYIVGELNRFNNNREGIIEKVTYNPDKDQTVIKINFSLEEGL